MDTTSDDLPDFTPELGLNLVNLDYIISGNFHQKLKDIALYIRDNDSCYYNTGIFIRQFSNEDLEYFSNLDPLNLEVTMLKALLLRAEGETECSSDLIINSIHTMKFLLYFETLCRKLDIIPNYHAYSIDLFCMSNKVIGDFKLNTFLAVYNLNPEYLSAAIEKASKS